MMAAAGLDALQQQVAAKRAEANYHPHHVVKMLVVLVAAVLLVLGVYGVAAQSRQRGEAFIGMVGCEERWCVVWAFLLARCSSNWRW